MAVSPRDLQSETLSLIHAARALLQEEETILASTEDCDYFRHLYRSNRRLGGHLPAEPAPLLAKKPVLAPVIGKTESPQRPLSIKEEPVSSKKEEIQPSAPVIADVKKIEAPDREFADLRKMLLHNIPNFPFIATIPNDRRAQQIAERWKMKNQAAAISVFYLQEPASQRQFLTNLASSLDVIFGSARLIQAEPIEKENQWDLFLSVPELKLAIIGDCALRQMPQLLKLYREIPQQNQRFLMEKPLMLLPDPTLYLKDPQLKRSLWKALCQKIGSL